MLLTQFPLTFHQIHNGMQLDVAATWIGLWTWIWSKRHCGLGFDRSNKNGSIDVKMDESVPEEKSSFKTLVLTFSSKLDWGSYIASIAKTAS